MNKKLLFTLIVGFIAYAMIPTANAQVVNLILFNSNFVKIQETGGAPINGNFQNVRYARVTFDDPIVANNNYSVATNFGLARQGDYAWIYWNGSSGVNINGGYIASSPTTASTSNQQQTGADTFYKQTNLTFNFKATSGTNATWFVQLDFGSPITIRHFELLGVSVANMGNSSDTIMQNGFSNIVNNQNANTQTIINNNNQNTQNIINSQNETTDAINDLNDTLQDTTIDDTAIGNQIAEITTISDTPISDLLTLPITLLQRVYNSINGSCSSYSLPFGFGLTNYTLNLPCIDLGHEKYLGRVVWGVVDDLFCIFMLFFLFKMIVWFFTNWTTLKDNFSYLIDPSNRGLF